jgi:hypothetical protein
LPGMELSGDQQQHRPHDHPLPASRRARRSPLSSPPVDCMRRRWPLTTTLLPPACPNAFALKQLGGAQIESCCAARIVDPRRNGCHEDHRDQP